MPRRSSILAASGQLERGLTLRSSQGPPPAWHLAREALVLIIRLAGQAPRRLRPLSSNVRRHKPRMSDLLLKHLERAVGPITTIFEEIVPGQPKLDLIHIESSFFRRYEVVVTRGMSANAMTVPPDCSEPHFAEVLAVLPKGWPVRQSAFGAEANYWPLRLLKTLAQHPFQANTWLGFGHTHANGSSEATVQPYAQNTELCAVVALPSLTLGEKAWSYTREDGQRVALWAVVPLYLTELKFKQANGVDALLDLLSKHRVTDIINPTRKRVA